MIQFIVDRFLDQVTLADLSNSEKKSGNVFEELLDHSNKTFRPKDIVS
jgi:hypothetical protein